MNKIIIVILSLFIWSCSPKLQPLNLNLSSLPKHFSKEQEDSLSLPILKDFIHDTLLLALLDTAINLNHDIQSSFQRIEMAKAGIREAKSAMLPTGGLTTVNSLRKFGLYTMDGAGNITTEITPGKIVPTHLPDYFLGGYASWEIDIWGKLKAGKKLAISNFWLSKEAHKLVIGGILSEISVSYFQLISLNNKQKLIDTIIRSQQLALLALIEHKEAGRGSELAVQQFIAQSKNLEILQNEISIEISKLENYINLLMGRYPQKIYTKQGVSDYEIKKLNTAGIPSQILENRPDIKMAYWELEKNKCNVEIVKSKFLPSFTISSSLGFQAFNPQFLIQSPTSMAYNLLGNISAPLINRGAIKADFKRASSSQLESMYQYQKIILTSYVEIVDRLNHINILESNLILREERVTALSKAVQASSELFKSSKANYLELLFVRQAELDAQWELLSNYSDLVIEEIQLYRSLGGFTLIN